MRIKSAALNEQTSCFFKIPELVLGYPIYNVEDCQKYIIRKLIENGFKVEKINDGENEKNNIAISWEHYE